VCSCTDGFFGVDCSVPPGLSQPSPPPRPPPSPPVATWNKADNGEAIALDIPKDIYAGNQSFYQAAFTAGLAQMMGIGSDTIYVYDFETSSSGGTIVYFNVVLYGSDSSSSAVNGQNLRNIMALFCDPVTGMNDATVTGTPACPALMAAFKAHGLPVAGAYYTDQNPVGRPEPTAWTEGKDLRLGPNASLIGTWNRADNEEAIAIDITLNGAPGSPAYAPNQESYQEAFTAAMAIALGVSVDAVRVSIFQQSTVGSTIIFFNVIMYGTSSSSSAVVTATVMKVSSLFAATGPDPTVQTGAAALPTCGSCPSANASVAGVCLCPKGLVDLFKQFGLPLENAYYGDQLDGTLVPP